MSNEKHDTMPSNNGAHMKARNDSRVTSLHFVHTLQLCIQKLLHNVMQHTVARTSKK